MAEAVERAVPSEHDGFDHAGMLIAADRPFEASLNDPHAALPKI